VIFGMPREAIEVDAVAEVAPLGKLREKVLARAKMKETTR
jgi:chemotaxis response regulator CheB